MGELARESGTDLRADELERLVAERDRYREALVQIANAHSGIWGTIAHEALRPRTTA